MVVVELGRDVDGRVVAGGDVERPDCFELGELLEFDLLDVVRWLNDGVERVDGVLDRELVLLLLVEVERVGDRDVDLLGSVRLVCAMAAEPITMMPATARVVTRLKFITFTSRGVNRSYIA